MARKEDACKIEIAGDFSLEYYASFQMLYVPLIGADSATLYQSLIAIGTRSQKISNHLLITSISGMSMDVLEKSRHILEQYLLVKTFYNAQDNAYIYQVYMPKSGNDFLRHEVFGRLYMKKMGRQVYEFNKLSFTPSVEDKQGYQDITRPFANILKEDWQEKEEAQFMKLKPDNDALYPNDMPLSFNYDRFLTGYSKALFPLTQRNAKNLRAIGELATIHGIDEMMMRKLVSQSMNLKDNTLKLDVLKQKVRNTKPAFVEARDDKHPYQLPPVLFLQGKQHGVDVSTSDKYLLETLIEDFHLKPEVVNVLVEYVLERTNQRLSKSYVEKVASVWVRLSIDTYEKALALIEDEQQKRTAKQPGKKALPQWFHEQHDDETNADIDEVQLQKLMKQLGGE